MGVKLHIVTSPFSNLIYCGSVLKDGVTWGANKTDVTGEACAAVAQHALERGGTVQVAANGEPVYEITVRALPPNASLHSPAGSEAEGVTGSGSSASDCYATEVGYAPKTD